MIYVTVQVQLGSPRRGELDTGMRVSFEEDRLRAILACIYDKSCTTGKHQQALILSFLRSYSPFGYSIKTNKFYTFLIPEFQANCGETLPGRESRLFAKRWNGFVTILQPVVGDSRVQMVNVVKADIG